MFVTYSATHLVIAHIVSVSSPIAVFMVGGNQFRVDVRMSNGDEHSEKYPTMEEAQVAVDALVKAIRG
ncbi:MULTISPECIES: hypothetical protein [Xanthomonas]|uniref:hypothetical protein n=1 Tax=Xanthomonas TaxID=338 RepID=UPI000998E012|nr:MULTISPECIES: hypothetical protein [Xanthomonas]OOW67108.1 hypothetical protein Xmar_07830 [Xanthomonas axonopodis pv. martyniicola]OOW90139.1 hypothetical protein Xvtr_19005 [Xanthomonas campestris pv. vitiscarnosae]PPU32139.1 hypothetical protein XspCFBP7912_13275 [Xanthomonas sp. CFBP 7912]